MGVGGGGAVKTRCVEGQEGHNQCGTPLVGTRFPYFH